MPQGAIIHPEGLRVVDLNLDPGDYYRLDDHLTPAGHRKVAQQLSKLLDDRK